jgi:outer membrane scaffolding protein for murein synthesis (MipA/OmpV family)
VKFSVLLALLSAVQLSVSVGTGAQDAPHNARPSGRPSSPPDFFAVGVAASGGQVEFRGGSFQVNPFPFINFRQGRLYSNQAGVGYEVLKSDKYRLSLVTEVGVNEQNRNQVDELNDMDNLDLPIYGGASLEVNVSDFVLTGTVQRELGFASQGWRAFAGVSRPYNINRKLSLSPSITLQWSDSTLTNYLYGVQSENALRSRPVYDTGSSLQGNTALTAVYRLSSKVTLIGSTSMTLYGNSIADSPIVDRRTILSSFVAIGYAF